MKKPANVLLIAFLGVLVFLGACSNDASEELPSTISNFVTQYFPGYSVKAYNELSGGNSVVQLSNGPTIKFDDDQRWIEVDGEGSTLPQVLMYDQLPPQLYEYLQATEQQSDVYEVKRDRYYYKLTMLDTVLTYDIATGKVTYPGVESNG